MAFLGLAVLLVSSCRNGMNISHISTLKYDSGHCAGCIMNHTQMPYTFVVRSGEDYEKLIEECFQDRVRGEELPPRPTTGEVLFYVSIEGGGCRGCLDIVGVRREFTNTIIEIQGGFEGACEMLIDLGAWVLIDRTVAGTPILFEFNDAACPPESKS